MYAVCTVFASRHQSTLSWLLIIVLKKIKQGMNKALFSSAKNDIMISVFFFILRCLCLITDWVEWLPQFASPTSGTHMIGLSLSLSDRSACCAPCIPLTRSFLARALASLACFMPLLQTQVCAFKAPQKQMESICLWQPRVDSCMRNQQPAADTQPRFLLIE